MQQTGIEWADWTWNPMSGCTPKSTGCLNCYARTMANRLRGMEVNGYVDVGFDVQFRSLTPFYLILFI